VDSAYEPPVFPELHIRSDQVDVGRAVKMIDDWLLGGDRAEDD
jgi:adenylylsulfate kinase